MISKQPTTGTRLSSQNNYNGLERVIIALMP
jgi:hypothetical protein